MRSFEHDRRRMIFSSKLGTRLGMPVEMPTTALVNGKAVGLGDIVQERRPHERRRWGCARIAPIDAETRQLAGDREDASGMVVHVKGVVRRALIETAHAGEFGNGSAHELGITDKRVTTMAGDEDSLELDADALTSDLVEQRRTFGEGLRRGRVHGKVESAGKAHRSQHAQRVLLKTAAGFTNRADLTTLQITATIVAVE